LDPRPQKIEEIRKLFYLRRNQKSLTWNREVHGHGSQPPSKANRYLSLSLSLSLDLLLALDQKPISFLWFLSNIRLILCFILHGLSKKNKLKWDISIKLLNSGMKFWLRTTFSQLNNNPFVMGVNLVRMYMYALLNFDLCNFFFFSLQNVLPEC
jgi:hypothetical protein